MIPSLNGTSWIPVTQGVEIGKALDPAGTSEVPNFQELLMKSWNEYSQLNQTGTQQVHATLMGEDSGLAETLTSLREADLALKLMMQIRNKLVDAYNEIQNLRM